MTVNAASGCTAADARPWVAVDWSIRRIHVTFDGATVAELPSLADLVAGLTAPHRIALEATFESWDPAARQAAVAAVRARGHELMVFRPLRTGRFRAQHPNLKKSDSNDARLIFWLATSSPNHLYPAPLPDAQWEEFRREVNRRYALLRQAGAKETLVAEAAKLLGPYTAVSGDARLVLGNGSTYRPSLLAAAYFAAQHSSSRPMFERLLGLHGSGYPSLLRSEVYHHSLRHAVTKGVSLTVFRRELRHVFSLVRASRRRPAAPPTVANLSADPFQVTRGLPGWGGSTGGHGSCNGHLDSRPDTPGTSTPVALPAGALPAGVLSSPGPVGQ